MFLKHFQFCEVVQLRPSFSMPFNESLKRRLCFWKTFSFVEWLQSSSSFVNFDFHASKEPLDWLNQNLTKILLSNYDDETRLEKRRSSTATLHHQNSPLVLQKLLGEHFYVFLHPLFKMKFYPLLFPVKKKKWPSYHSPRQTETYFCSKDPNKYEHQVRIQTKS